MANKQVRTTRERKELNNKIAEIIWLVISGALFLWGFIFSLMGALIQTITGNFKKSPLYFLVESQDKFFAWVLTWWKDCPLKSYSTMGIVIMIIGLVLLLIVLFLFSNKSEALEKKEKARKQRESNVKRFEAQLDSIQEAKPQEQTTQPQE